MAEPLKRLATLEDLDRTPDDGLVYEIIGGDLEAQPRPAPGHSRGQAGLAGLLFDPFDRGRRGPGGWWILIEPEVQFGHHDIVVPDLAGWRRERMPVLPPRRPISVVPDWTCEFVSVTGRRRDRVRKADLYLRAGVPHYWIVDVEERTLEALEARQGAWLRLGAWSDGDTPRIAPFDLIELDVASLFPPLDPE